MREPLREVSGVVTPLDRPNVDTDQIVPKQFLKLVQRSGFGRFLFHGWRGPGFPLDDPRYAGSPVLAAGENFGCGSSREHAAWALADHGFRAVVAPSFADIFYDNCYRSGVLPVRLPAARVADLLGPGPVRVRIDLESQEAALEGGWTERFEADPRGRRALLGGLDDIDLTLERAAEIDAYERRSPPPPCGPSP